MGLLSGISGNNANAGNDIMNMLALSRVDPTTAIGYKLGQYLGNYASRGQERNATNAEADQDMQKRISQIVANNTTTGQNLSKAIDGFNALNPNNTNNAGQGSDWNALGAKYGSVSNTLPTSNSGGMLSGIEKTPAYQQVIQQQNGGNSSNIGVDSNLLDAVNSNGTIKTAQGSASNSSNNLLGNIGSAVGGINSVDKLTNGKGNLFDIANIAKIAGFFEPAASPSQDGAASQSSAKQSNPIYTVSDNIPGMVEAGNIDLSKRPVVKNEDGSISTVRSMSFDIDGTEILVPTVSDDGKIMTNEQAIDQYMKTGENLGKFDSPDAADAYAQTLHEQQDKMYSNKDSQQPEQQQSIADIVRRAMPTSSTKQFSAIDLSNVNPYAGSGVASSLADLAKTAASQPTPTVEATPAQRLASSKIESDLIQTKAAYQQAQANGDTAGMQQAHDAANTIRNAAAVAGINISSMDAGSTLQDAVNRKSSDDYMQQIRDIVNPDKTSQEYYNEVYNRLRNQGYGYDVANSVAARKAQNYQAQRISTLSSQLGYQGLGSSGAVNNLGAQVLTKLLNESPDTYKALANMYAMPKDDYLFNNTIKQAVTNEGLQKDLSGYNSGLRMNESDHNLGNTIKLNDHNLGNQMRLKQFEVGLSVQQKAAMDQIALKTQGMSMQQKYGIMYNAAKQFGMDEDSASKYALGLTGKGANVKSLKYSEPMSTAMDYTFNVIKNSDAKTSGAAIDQYQETLDKYEKQMDGEDAALARDMMYVFNFLREKKAGNEDIASQYYSAIPDYLKAKYLSEY